MRYINYLNDEGSIETLKSFRDVRKYLTPKIRNGTLEKPAKMKVEEYLEIGQYCRGLLSILCLQLSEFSHHPHASPWNYDFRVAWFFIFVSTWTHAPPHIAIIITFFFFNINMYFSSSRSFFFIIIIIIKVRILKINFKENFIKFVWINQIYVENGFLKSFN